MTREEVIEMLKKDKEQRGNCFISDALDMAIKALEPTTMATLERETEIATMALNKLKEIDPDMAQRFMIEEIEMDVEEIKFHGADRVRKATCINWCFDEADDPTLPKEVDIPCDVLDDDVADYLSDTYGFLVDDFDVEEEEQ